jgi:hypothetical protein
VILVVGRPRLTERGELDGTSALVAVAAAEQGTQVELVGSVGYDADGDAVAVELGRAGVGHAALLRDPVGVTPRAGGIANGLPRLDAADVELGLRYIVECRVLIVAEPISAATLAVAIDAAAYHGADLVVLVPPGAKPPTVPESATVLEMPAAGSSAFAALVGRYAALLDAGRPQPDAWHDALAGSDWEQSE